jgi:GlpG protein
MRIIGHLASEPNARIFGDFLYVQGIENRVEFEKDSGWAVWVNDEDKLQQAATLLAEYQSNPSDPRYSTKAVQANGLRARKEKDEAAYRKKLRDRTTLFPPLTMYGLGPLSLVLIIISVVVFVRSNFGREMAPVSALFISEYLNAGLREVFRGEVWRLLTPIFLHSGPLHILFNMLWLRDLGSMIEARQGSLYFALLVVVIGVGSNVAQFLVSGPNFCGMSGVVFGLLGFAWLRGKFDPASGLMLHPTTVTMMLIWLGIGYTGIMPIANTAHTVGLLIGIAWGYLSALRYR